MIYIRIDTNSYIGMGHAMRCLAIADALCRVGECVTFITADNNGKKIVEERGYKLVSLDSKWNEPEQELEKLLEFIKINPAKCILVDKYEVTEKYLKELQKIIKVAYLDDLNSFKYPCDFLIVYANYYKKYGYEAQYGKNVKLMLGTDYVPLREEYGKQEQRKINSNGNNIIFLSGGTDNYGVTLAFINELIRQQVLEEYSIRIICGAFHKDIESLQIFSKKYQNIDVLVQVKDMWKHMEWADIGVSAGGTTLYELSACGTPFITYSIANNQLDNVQWFEKENQIYYAGDMRTDLEENMKNLVSELNSLKDNQNRREIISRSLQQLVDGKGSQRIAEILCQW